MFQREKFLLAETLPIDHSHWKNIKKMIKMDQGYQQIIFEAYNKELGDKIKNGHLLIDQIYLSKTE